MSWYNSDGLLVKFGAEEGVPGIAGEYRTHGPTRQVEVVLNVLGLSATDGSTILDDNVFFGIGWRIEKVDVISQTVCTGTNAVLNIGLIKVDRATELDYNGIVAAIPVTSLATAGQTTSLTAGATYAGALLGTNLAFVGYLTADYDTAAFTAGRVVVRISYSVPIVVQ